MPENDVIKPVGTLKPLTQSNPIPVKPVGKLKPFTPITPRREDPHIKMLQNEQDQSTTLGIIDSLPEMPGDTQSKKEQLKDLVKNGASADEVNNSILVLQGKHPSQEGGTKYYTNEKGLPVPLKNSEKPPAGFHVASIFGTAKDAKDDNIVTDLAKTAWNIIPSVAENVADLVQTGYEALTDKSSENINAYKNYINSKKFEIDPDIQGSLYNTEGINSAADLFDTKRFDLTPKTIWGNALSLGQSVGEMLIPAGTINKAVKGTNWAYKTANGVTKLTTAGKAATVGAASFITNHGEVKDAAERAGLEGRDLALFSTLVTVPIAAIDTRLGIGSKIFENAAIKQEKDAFILAAAKKVMEKKATGELTKEALDEAVKETMVTYPQIAKSWATQVGKDVLEQGGEESAQAFIQKAGEQVWDNITDDEKKKFGTDAFSAKSFGEYFQNFLAGAIGGGPAVVGFNAAKQKEQEYHKNSTVFGVVQNGEESIKNFKRNVVKEQEEGELTEQEANDALTRVNAFDQYNKEITPLNIPEDEKRELFDLVFQKENLKSKLNIIGDPKKLGPIGLGIYDGIEKQASDLQKKINETILSAQVKTEPRVSDKTLNDVTKTSEKSKEESKHPEALTEMIKKFKSVANKEETRSYEEIPVAEYNSNKLNARTKHAKTVEYLEKQPNQTVVGTIAERHFEYGNKKDKVFGVTLPDGKTIRFSSSMKRDEGFRGHFREEQFQGLTDKDLAGLPVAIKSVTVPGGKEGAPKKAIKAYNTKTGKFIGWIKATNTGGNTKNKGLPEFTKEQVEGPGGLLDLEMVVEPPVNGTDAETQPNPEIPVKPTINQFVADKIEELKNDPESQFDEDLANNGTYKRYFEKQYEKQFGETQSASATEQTENKPAETEKTISNSEGQRNKTLVTGTKKSNRKIKAPALIKALKHEVNNPYDYILQYFISGGKINFKSVEKLLGSPKEALSRVNYIYNQVGSIEKVSHNIWEQFVDETGIQKYDTSDFVNEMEEAIAKFAHPSEMAAYLNDKYEEGVQYAPLEEVVNDAVIDAEKEGISDQMNDAIEALEELSDKSLEQLSDNGNDLNQYLADEGIDYKSDILTEGDDPLFSLGDNIKNIGKKHYINTINELNGKSNKEVLEFVRSKLIDKSVIETTNVLIENIHKIKTKFKGFDGFDGFDKNISHALAYYYKREIIFNKDSHAIYQELYEAIVHEYLHAFLYDSLQKQNFESDKKFTKEITDIFNKLKSNTKYPKEYGLTNVHEFVSEIMSNPDFVEKMKADPNSKSFFYKFIDAILSLFGINKISKENEALVKEGIEKIVSFIQNDSPYQLDDVNYDNNSGPVFKITKNKFDEYREKNLGRDLKKIKELRDYIKEQIDSGDLSDDEVQELIDARNGMANEYQEDKESYNDFINGVDEVKKISKSKNLSEYTLEDLISAWNVIKEAGNYYGDEFDDIKRRIAEYVNQEQLNLLKKNKNYTEAQKRDMTWREVWIKTLSDVSQEFPLIQGLSNIYEEKVLEKSTEIKARKQKLEKLAKDVIKERNKLLGSPSDWFTSDSAKYFEFVDDKGKLRTNKTGLSPAQSKYLDYITELITEKNEGLTDETVENEIIKIDKGFQETWRDEGVRAAVLGYFKANTQENSTYLNYNGRLTSKFNQSRDKDKGYSKDFYKAGLALIEDLAHVKYMNEVVPIVDATELFYKELGFDENKSFNNTLKFLEEWKNEQLYEKNKITDPKIDASLRFLRRLTSATVMGFNVPANIMNAVMGNYNAWRKEGLSHWVKGQKRLFGGVNRAGYGTINKKALDIIKMFDVVEMDVDSNPKISAGNLFSALAFAGQTWGEFQIQGSQFLGFLTDEEMNSFEYDKNGDLKLKDSVNKKEFTSKMLEYKQNVHNIQGKYASKDRRNFMRFEAGKAAAQFRLWIPDFMKERFGSEFIDRNGNTQRGSWRMFTETAIKELKEDFKNKGAVKAIWEDKRIMSNLKGAMTVAFLLIATNQDDDDEDVRKQTLSLDNALSNLLFILDPQQTKYMLSSPAAGLTKVTNFIDAMDGAMKGDSNKFSKNAKKLVPYNKALDVAYPIEKKVVPYGKAITEIDNLVGE